jgi:DNA replication initiation complex subunit (GINS family)
MQEEALTYDALRRVERQENTSPRLTKLEPGFWERLGEHLGRLRDEFQAQQEEDPTARRTVVLADELRNTQRLAESIWSLREKKVVQAAMGAVRRREGGMSVPENATKQERDLFASAMEVMVAARDEAAITDPFAKRRRDRAEGGTDQAASRSTSAPVARTKDVASGMGHPTASAGAGVPAAASATVSGSHDSKRVGAGADEAAGTLPGRRRGEGEGPGGVPREGEGSEGGLSRQPAPGPGEEETPQAQALEGGEGMGGAGEQEVELRVVQALKEVPLFAGPDLITYELKEGEVGSIPVKAASILEQRGLVRILGSG